MIVLYELTDILYHIVLAYIFSKYNGIFYARFRFSSSAKHIIYILLPVTLILIPHFVTDFYMQYLANFLVFLCTAFCYQGPKLRQIAATALFAAAAFALDLLLIFLSYKFHLRFYNYLSYNHVVYTALYLITMYLFVQIVGLARDIKNKRTSMTLHLLSTMSLPLASLYLLTCAFLSENLKLNYTFFINVLLLIGFLVFSIFENDRRERMINLQLEQSLIRSQNEAYLSQIALLQASGASMEKLRHDFRNHMEVLHSILASSPSSQAEEYLERIRQEIKPEAVISDTGSPVIDSLVNTKLSSCKKSGITVRYHAVIPNDLRIDAFALTIILGNLLDNAMEAVKKDTCTRKKIDLTLTFDRNCLIIALKNTYDGFLQTGGGSFLTNKANPALHGIGLKNVAQTIESKGGMLTFDYDERWFVVTAIIPCE